MNQKFCTHCGAKLTPGAKFCSNCGAKVGTASSTTTNAKLSDKFSKFKINNRYLIVGLVVICLIAIFGGVKYRNDHSLNHVLPGSIYKITDNNEDDYIYLAFEHGQWIMPKHNSKKDLKTVEQEGVIKYNEKHYSPDNKEKMTYSIQKNIMSMYEVTPHKKELFIKLKCKEVSPKKLSGKAIGYNDDGSVDDTYNFTMTKVGTINGQ
ncbi:zinc-ribbon domain-containing protein [Limosilactobacillus sp.]|uniref:zinc-ribbon domain-containing protein n=1 Tax=Limosilactobacillus sp. TaxID=2773925 RepID=UPI00345EDFE4